ncbi:MAG: hypothetical protein LBD06_10985 [Candidatus Accumulibacter sp.]|nr:hypothetical protein [Accumulibacter sp.]
MWLSLASPDSTIQRTEDRGQRTDKFAALHAEWGGKIERSVFRSSPGAKRRKLLCLLSSQAAVL